MAKKQRKCWYQLKTKARFELNTLKSTLFLCFLAFSMNKTFLYCLFLESSVSERVETPRAVTNPLFTGNPYPSLEKCTSEYFTSLCLWSENDYWISPIYILCLWTCMFPSHLTCVSKPEHSEIKFSWEHLK